MPITSNAWLTIMMIKRQMINNEEGVMEIGGSSHCCTERSG